MTHAASFGDSSLLVASLPTSVAWPTGITNWEHLGAVLVWLLLMALVGSLIGMLRGSRAAVPPADSEAHHVEDESIPHAA